MAYDNFYCIEASGESVHLHMLCLRLSIMYWFIKFMLFMSFKKKSYSTCLFVECTVGIILCRVKLNLPFCI